MYIGFSLLTPVISKIVCTNVTGSDVGCGTRAHTQCTPTAQFNTVVGMWRHVHTTCWRISTHIISYEHQKACYHQPPKASSCEKSPASYIALQSTLAYNTALDSRRFGTNSCSRGYQTLDLLQSQGACRDCYWNTAIFADHWARSTETERDVYICGKPASLLPHVHISSDQQVHSMSCINYSFIHLWKMFWALQRWARHDSVYIESYTLVSGHHHVNGADNSQ